MEKRVSILLACLAISALAISTASYGQTINLIDPGFEGAVTGAGGVGGWGTFGGATFSSDVAHSGTNSMKEFGAGGYSVPGAFETFPAAAGDAWTFSGFALTPGINTNLSLADFGGVQIAFFSGTGANLGTVETAPGTALFGNKITGASTPNVWIPVSVTAHAPVGTASVQMFDIVIDQTPTHMYFDDMSALAFSVPEPSTVVLSLTGLFGLVAFAKKRRV